MSTALPRPGLRSGLRSGEAKTNTSIDREGLFALGVRSGEAKPKRRRRTRKGPKEPKKPRGHVARSTREAREVSKNKKRKRQDKEKTEDPLTGGDSPTYPVESPSFSSLPQQRPQSPQPPQSPQSPQSAQQSPKSPTPNSPNISYSATSPSYCPDSPSRSPSRSPRPGASSPTYSPEDPSFSPNRSRIQDVLTEKDVLDQLSAIWRKSNSTKKMACDPCLKGDFPFDDEDSDDEKPVEPWPKENKKCSSCGVMVCPHHYVEDERLDCFTCKKFKCGNCAKVEMFQCSFRPKDVKTNPQSKEQFLQHEKRFFCQECVQTCSRKDVDSPYCNKDGPWHSTFDLNYCLVHFNVEKRLCIQCVEDLSVDL